MKARDAKIKASHDGKECSGLPIVDEDCNMQLCPGSNMQTYFMHCTKPYITTISMIINSIILSFTDLSRVCVG